MSFLLLTGLIFAGVPLLLIIGFCVFIFLQFTRDDNDAAAVARIAYIMIILGTVMIVAHIMGAPSPTWSGGF